ncbi:MAG TPA: formyltransferase family protein [Planctomycetaceae bacterium]
MAEHPSETATVVVMANDRPGLRVCEYLAARGDRIARLYLHEPEGQKLGDAIRRASKCRPDQVFTASALSDPAHVQGLRDLAPDYIITVYWAHLLKPEVFRSARRSTVNFHPAMLPINRGWFPHVHSILDGSPTGVTLHAIDDDADTGPIWAQRPVAMTAYDTAFTIYQRLQTEIVHLFRETWPEIVAGRIAPRPQSKEGGCYHKKSEIGRLDEIDPNATMKVSDLLKILKARSFGDLGFAYVEENGERVYLNLRVGRSTNFSVNNSELF